jgi:hypothetical protein
MVQMVREGDIVGGYCLPCSCWVDNGDAEVGYAFPSRAIHEGIVMSIPVDLSRLAETMQRYRFAYLLTSSERGAPHALAVTPVLQDGQLVVGETGRRTRDNALQRPDVALVWPPQSESDYSLIVDGHAVVADGILRVTPARAVLHRPTAPRQPAAPGACGSDCVEIA